jgi:Bacterial PH domain
VTFIFEPPKTLLIIPLVLVVVGLLGAVLMRSRGPGRRAIRLIIALVLAVVLLLRYHSNEVTVDDAGIVADTSGKPQIQWSRVQSARSVADLSASSWMPRPSLKSAFRIFGYASARYGWFDLDNGKQALFAVQSLRQPAVVIETADATYVISPNDAEAFVMAVAQHIPL